jgi:RNA polymerase sigma-70 factor (ECF subfamily)
VPELHDHEAQLPAFDPELLASLPRLLADLPSASGAAVRLRYLEDLSLLEVAEALEIPLGTAKSRVNYGLTVLRERLHSDLSR